MKIEKKDNKLIVEIEQGKEMREFDRFFHFHSVRDEVRRCIKEDSKDFATEFEGIIPMATNIDNNICKLFPEISKI